MFKPKSDRSAKLFSEFPWMWAIRPGHTPDLKIFIQELEGQHLSLPIRERVSWWGVVRAGESAYVKKIGASPTESLADSLVRIFDLRSTFALLSPDFEITHLVSFSDLEKAYEIHRPRRNVPIADVARIRATKN